MSRDAFRDLVNEDLERALVGSLLIDPEAISQVAERVHAGDFYQQSNRWLYEAIQGLYERRCPIDYVTVCDQLQADGHLVEVGGTAFVVGLLNATPTSMHARSYADGVHKLGVLRQLVLNAGKIAALAYHGASHELDEVLARAQRLVDAVAPLSGDESVLLWLDSLERCLEAQRKRTADQEAIARGQVPSTLDLPWITLKRFSLRLRPGSLTIVAGGSGIGKTSFLECCAEHWARQGFQVAFFHLELSHQHMLDRRLARLTGLALDQIEDGATGDAIDDARKRLKAYPGGITYVHCPGATVSRVANQARKLHAKGLCDVAIVDYLQKLTLVYKQGQNKADHLGDAAETFKIAAERLGIPLLLGSQFNRGVEHVARKTGAYIRGSGEPHEKANVVITLDRAILGSDAFDEEGKVIASAGQRSPVMAVRVDKNTGGATGDAKLVMNAARFLILDPAPRCG